MSAPGAQEQTPARLFNHLAGAEHAVPSAAFQVPQWNHTMKPTFFERPHAVVANRGLRLPCQNSASRSLSLFSRPCCRPAGMPLRKVAVADTAVVAMAVVMAREVVVAIMAVVVIMREAAVIVAVMSAVRTSAVGATSVDERRVVRFRNRVSTAIALSLSRP